MDMADAITSPIIHLKEMPVLPFSEGEEGMKRYWVWNDKLHSEIKIGVPSYIHENITDVVLASEVEAENAKRAESHAKIIASWKREELGWDKERADLTASLAQANARLEVIRDALETLLDAVDEFQVGEKGMAGKKMWEPMNQPTTVQDLRLLNDAVKRANTAISAQPKGDLRERGAKALFYVMDDNAFEWENEGEDMQKVWGERFDRILSSIAGVEK